MKYCAKCGSELLDEAVICPHCGCAVEGMNITITPRRNKNSRITGLEICIMIFMVLGAISSVFYFDYYSYKIHFIFPALFWTVPMTIYCIYKIVTREKIGLTFKICTIFFCSLIAAILLLCRRETDNL